MFRINGIRRVSGGLSGASSPALLSAFRRVNTCPKLLRLIDMLFAGDRIEAVMFLRCRIKNPAAKLTFWMMALVYLGLLAGPQRAFAQANTGAADPRVAKLYEEAKEAEAAGNLSDAEARYQSILQIAPRLAAAYNNLGALYLRQREFPKAASALEQGLKINPNMPSATALLGIAKYEMGDYKDAQARLEAAVRANPKDDNAQLYLANSLIQLGEFEAASARLEQIAHRQPQNQEAWYLLGKVYMKLAEQALGKLNEIDPNSVLVHEVSGEIMESMNNFDGALVEYKKAVEMAPQTAGTHYRLANAYWSLRMWDAATQEFQAELAVDPRNCRAQWQIGNILLEQHMEPEKALAEVQKALDLCPNLMEARVDRARALLKLGRAEEASKDLRAAEQADPSEASTHFLLAQAYRAMGQPKEAQAEMEIFSKLEESARAKTAERAKQLLQEKSSTP